MGVFIKNGRHRYLHTKNATGCLHYIQKLVEDVANQSIISKEDPNYIKVKRLSRGRLGRLCYISGGQGTFFAEKKGRVEVNKLK